MARSATWNCARVNREPASDVVFGEIRLLEEVTEQADLQRPVAVDWHGDPDGVTRFAVDVMASLDAK
jgi:hypothetical protein